MGVGVAREKPKESEREEQAEAKVFRFTGFLALGMLDFDL